MIYTGIDVSRAPFPEFDFPEEREKSRADVYLQIDSGISEKKPEDPYFYVHMGLISNNSYFTLIISIFRMSTFNFHLTHKGTMEC